MVKGPLIWLDENGDVDGIFDVHDYIALCKEHYEKVGIGADYDRRADPLTPRRRTQWPR